MAASGLLFGLQPRKGAPPGTVLVFLVPLAGSAVALVAAFRARRLLSYYVALSFRVLAFLLTVPSTSGDLLTGSILLTGILCELCCFEPYPASLAESLGVAAAAVALCLVSTAGLSPAGAAWPMRQLSLGILGAAVSIFGCHMTRFRGLVVDLVADRERLSDSVVQLTRANSAYQDFAVRAQESATEKERQRITRDIHDIVGYTLTNNMMLLEAAMDLMQENPLGLPTIIETARANAEEGLGRVRAAMYRLRRQESPYPRGVDAISRLARVFEQATSIRVRCEFANLPWTLPEKVDSTLYHLVQECLVNAFRHAQATEVRVVFWYERGVVSVHIADDGVGAKQVIEGIGIRGMRERVEALGGSLRAGPAGYGFSVSATIPAGFERSDVNRAP
jgi:signal transduction histidine kinase